jgi:hypothetical protein
LSSGAGSVFVTPDRTSDRIPRLTVSNRTEIAGVTGCASHEQDQTVGRFKGRSNTMGLKLNVGISRKVGQPDFGSLGATCNLELELDGTLLERDPPALQARIREAYQAAQQAVQDELARLTGQAPAHKQRGDVGNQQAEK